MYGAGRHGRRESARIIPVKFLKERRGGKRAEMLTFTTCPHLRQFTSHLVLKPVAKSDIVLFEFILWKAR